MARARDNDAAYAQGFGAALPNTFRAIYGAASQSGRETAAAVAELAPQLVQRNLIDSTATVSRSLQSSSTSSPMTLLGRGPARWLSASATRPSGSTPRARDLVIRERVDELLALPIPDAGPSHAGASDDGRAIVSLLAGFQATAPSAGESRAQRRRRRAGLVEAHLGLEDGAALGLKARGDRARGLLSADSLDGLDDDRPGARRQSGMGSAKKGRRKSLAIGLGGPSLPAGQSDAAVPELSRDELEQEAADILRDRSNIDVRRGVLAHDIEEVDRKMAELDAIRQDLKRRLLGLREEQLELDDELEGVQGRLANLEVRALGRAASFASSRRRKGPAFLPSEHDDLPVNVAFMTLSGHTAPITALDFTEPYGTLVSASADETVRLWDLTTGDEIGRLRGHAGAVKALQVESSLCITGGVDGSLRIWDLDRIDEDELALPSTPTRPGKLSSEYGPALGAVAEEDEDEPSDRTGPCMQVMHGHSRDVTALYFEGSCLVTGSSDKTLRQWDLQTGVLTMDILWAISNPAASQSLAASPPPSPSASNAYFDLPVSPRATPSRQSMFRRQSSIATPMPPLADGSWDFYQDFVGGVQFWSHALASGSHDGCVRLWDTRTGQCHRTLIGHIAPVTCLQFDDHFLVSGSLDKSIRIWDLRTGAIADTMRYDHPITALQFDSRKIVAAAGENAIRNYNRTTLAHSALSTNGHTAPAERLRFMDRYLATGSRDATVKLWSFA